jgi:hypothetical protein
LKSAFIQEVGTKNDEAGSADPISEEEMGFLFLKIIFYLLVV